MVGGGRGRGKVGSRTMLLPMLHPSPLQISFSPQPFAGIKIKDGSFSLLRTRSERGMHPEKNLR